MEIPIRATVVFFFLLLLTRGLGKRELSQLTAFELMLLVTVGDLVQQGVTQEDMSLTGAVLAVGTIGFWIMLFSVASFRLPWARPLLDGFPVVIVAGGSPDEEMMRYERITMDELREEARGQGIGDLREVSCAVLEPDGRISFVRNDGSDGGAGANQGVDSQKRVT